MYTRQTTVYNKAGLHTRPASEFVKAAIPFVSSIKISKITGGRSGKTVDAKSLVWVLSLSVACGDRIEISAEGGDERAAVDALIAVVDSGFGESEAT